MFTDRYIKLQKYSVKYAMQAMNMYIKLRNLKKKHSNDKRHEGIQETHKTHKYTKKY